MAPSSKRRGHVEVAGPRRRFHVLLEELLWEFEKEQVAPPRRERPPRDHEFEGESVWTPNRSSVLSVVSRRTLLLGEDESLEFSETSDQELAETEEPCSATELRWARLVHSMTNTAAEERLWVRDCWLPQKDLRVAGPSTTVRNIFARSTSPDLDTPDFLEEAVKDVADVGSIVHTKSALDRLGHRHMWTSMICKRRNTSDCFIHPESYKRMLWGLPGLCLIMLDVLWLTLQVFGVSEIYTYQVASAVYWSADVAVNFRIGFHTQWGGVILEQRAIARRYLRSWFCFDILAVSLDLCLVLANVGTGGVGFLRYVRVARYLRLARLLRFRRTSRHLTVLLHSDLFELAVKLFACLVGLGIWIHLSATAWFLVGSSVPSGWVKQSADFDHLPLSYLMAVHWAASQLGGGIDVFPTHDPLERAFAVVHLMLSLCVLAIVVSKVTNIMHTIQERHLERSRHVRIAQSFLASRSISRLLAMRVLRYLQRIQAFQEKFAQTTEEDELLSRLPCHLRRALLEEARFPLLRRFLVFNAWCRCSPHFAQRVACDVIRMQVQIADEYIFHCGSVCGRVYIVGAGAVHYLPYPKILRTHFISEGHAGGKGVGSPVHAGSGAGQSPRLGAVGDDADLEAFHLRHRSMQGIVSSGSMIFCEAAMWTPWIHRGDLEPTMEVSLMVLDVAELCALAAAFPTLVEGMRAHAQRFVKALRRSDHTDMFHSGHVMMQQRSKDSDFRGSLSDGESESNAAAQPSEGGSEAAAAAPDEQPPHDPREPPPRAQEPHRPHLGTSVRAKAFELLL